MWNVFDSTFIVVTTLYLILRVKGLSSGDCEWRFLFYLSQSPIHKSIASTSDLGFDILACGACILFPRFDRYLVPLAFAFSTAA
jgi:hypothetical protein